MRELPIFGSGTGVLTSNSIKTAHLFELELAQLKVMETAASGSSFIVVDDIDKCFIGQILAYLPAWEAINKPKFVTVTGISLILNQLTISAPLEDDLAFGDRLYETLYDETEYPEMQINGADDVYRLQLWHSAFGTLCGRMLFTDFDVPIVAKLSDGLFDPEDNYGVYIPYPIDYKGTSYDVQGRMSNVELNVANVDQRFSNIVLTHEGLRKRKVKIYSVFLGSATEINLNVPIAVNANVTLTAGVTSSTGDALATLNAPFNVAYYDAADDKTQEFEGLIDNLSYNDKTVTITVLNYMDSADMTMIPRNLYTRGRCQFVYRGPRCRYVSSLTLYATATASDTVLRVLDTEGKFPLAELKDNETQIIMIGQEQILVTSVSSATSTIFLSQEAHHSMGRDGLGTLVSAQPERFVYLLNVTREYNSTTAATHEADSSISIILCRKTFHDCRLHFHERMFGGFPAIPKQIYNV